MTAKRLGDRLVEEGIVDRKQVEHAARRAAKTGKRIGEILMDCAGVDDRDIYRALAEQYGLNFMLAEDIFLVLDPSLSNVITRRFQDHYRLVPFLRKGDKIHVATPDPTLIIPELAGAVGASEVIVNLVTPNDYRRIRSTLDLMALNIAGENARSEDVLPETESEDEQITAEMSSLFNSILLDAISERASDIHLEIYQKNVRIRLRIDGELHEVPRYQLSRRQLLGMVNVIKVRANLDIAERRLPQGGRMTLQKEGKSYDLRVQTQPSLHGEHVIIRVLPQDAKLIGIEDLGFSPDLAAAYRRILNSPGGLVLVVGPTGSGKSTTLYAGLQVLAKDVNRKVITVEDPIEYAIDNIQQTQTSPYQGFTFASAMRAFVREDPDVILVGEVRDGETALEAIRASQTGHLVLTTLHCNDAVDAVQRLLDLGMHPNSIASELLAIFAQRLAKRICESCKEKDAAPSELLAEIFPAGVPADFECFRGRGCVRCQGLGTRGRIAVAEYLPATPGLRRAISQQLSLDDLRDAALDAGLLPFREQALNLVRHGVIRISELPRLLPPERMAPDRRVG